MPPIPPIAPTRLYADAFWLTEVASDEGRSGIRGPSDSVDGVAADVVAVAEGEDAVAAAKGEAVADEETTAKFLTMTLSAYSSFQNGKSSLGPLGYERE